jgi:acetoin:2,6-dichlorophenolindophenol oxidoreductase subunit beta
MYMLDKKNSKIDFAQQIKEGLDEVLASDPSTLIMGLGVTDPKGVFGTTLGLSEKYGPKRVIETPTSENAITGIGVGLAITGYRPIMVHQRLDFFLLAMDQLVNSAAKWHYMFGGQQSVPITIRLITGRGWGQGPTHSQNLHSWFTHIPGLKVVMPSLASDVKSLLIASIKDPNPVIFIEDRWCHVQKIDRSSIVNNSASEIGKAEVIEHGEDLTIVAAGFSTIQSLRAVKLLRKFDINIDLIDLKTLKPLDTDTIFNSVNKTGKLLVVDSGPQISSFASEIVSQVCRSNFQNLKSAPEIITAPDIPEPTSYGVTDKFKFNSKDIAIKVLEMLGKEINNFDLTELVDSQYDVPNSSFTGPF